MQEIVISELNNDEVVQPSNPASLTVNDASIKRGIELLAAQLTRINARFDAFNVASFAQQLARGFLSRLDRNNARVMSKNIQNVTGVDLAGQIRSRNLDQLLEVRIAENAALITSIKNDYVQDVGKVIRDNLLAGERSTRLITEIKDRGGVTENRAKLIARTETSRINSQITQLRSEALGSTTYIWSTVIDERTRDKGPTNHKVMDGKLCKFNDVTVFSDDDGETWRKRSEIGGPEILPGDIYNCRCTALPVVNFG